MVLGKPICTALCHCDRQGWMFGRADDRLTINNYNSLPCLFPNKYKISHQKNASNSSLMCNKKATYLTAPSPKSLDHLPIQPERKWRHRPRGWASNFIAWPVL
jgi:hypothetical protein